MVLIYLLPLLLVSTSINLLSPLPPSYSLGFDITWIGSSFPYVPGILDQLQDCHFFKGCNFEKIQIQVLSPRHHIIVIFPPVKFSVDFWISWYLADCSLCFFVSHWIFDDPDIEHKMLIKILRTLVKSFCSFFCTPLQIPPKKKPKNPFWGPQNLSGTWYGL